MAAETVTKLEPFIVIGTDELPRSEARPTATDCRPAAGYDLAPHEEKTIQDYVAQIPVGKTINIYCD